MKYEITYTYDAYDPDSEGYDLVTKTQTFEIKDEAHYLNLIRYLEDKCEYKIIEIKLLD